MQLEEEINETTDWETSTPSIRNGNMQQHEVSMDIHSWTKKYHWSTGYNWQYRLFHTKIIEFTFFSSSHRIFTKTDHNLVHKTQFNKIKVMEIINGVFSECRGC